MSRVYPGPGYTPGPGIAVFPEACDGKTLHLQTFEMGLRDNKAKSDSHNQ